MVSYWLWRGEAFRYVLDHFEVLSRAKNGGRKHLAVIQHSQKKTQHSRAVKRIRCIFRAVARKFFEERCGFTYFDLFPVAESVSLVLRVVCLHGHTLGDRVPVGLVLVRDIGS